MTDLDRLERLNRLRESGGLSDEEYQNQKANLLVGQASASGSNFGWLWWVTPVILGLLIMGLLFSRDSREREASMSDPAGVTNEVSVIAAESPLQDTSATPVMVREPPVSLTFATSMEVIGLNPAYLEKRLGVPKERSNDYASYEVGGCTISYGSEGNQVTSFSVDVSSSCQPIIEGHRVSLQTTFGELRKREDWGSYAADCLTGCGNAADPTIELIYPGSRATQFIGVSYSADYDQIAIALNAWEKAVRADRGLDEFEDPEDNEVFLCVTDPPASVGALITEANVASIRVGRELRSC